jgi:hypothetical protein
MLGREKNEERKEAIFLLKNLSTHYLKEIKSA